MLRPPKGINFGAVAFCARFTLKNIFRPFEQFGLRAGPEMFADSYFLSSEVSLSDLAVFGLALLSTLQTVLTFMFFALFLLALRRRFKMD
jgi:hypothetical protein